MDKFYSEAIKQIFNGTRYKFSSVIDNIFFVGIRFIAIYIILMEYIISLNLRLLLTIIISIIVALIVKLVNNAKFKKNEEILRLKAKKEIIRHKLLSMPNKEAVALLNDSDRFQFLIQKSSLVTLDDIYEIIRTCACKNISDFDIIGTMDLEPEADLFLKKHFKNKIIYKNVSCFDVNFLTSDDEITEWIIDEYKKGKSPRKIIRITTNAKKYLSIALILLGLSFIVRFKIYMRLTAILSFSIAGLCIVLSERTQPRE